MLAVALLRGGEETPAPLIGQPAPDFTLVTLDGQRFRLRDHLGQPILVNFWASWCVPCREEAPLLGELAKSARNLTLVGVVFQDQPNAARNFVKEFKLPFPSVLDPRLSAAIDYGVSGVPESFLIDARGIVREKRSGAFTREALLESVRRLGVRF